VSALRLRRPIEVADGNGGLPGALVMAGLFMVLRCLEHANGNDGDELFSPTMSPTWTAVILLAAHGLRP